MEPKFGLDDIKYSESLEVYQRAIGLFRNGKVEQFQYYPRGYSAIVKGSQSYKVSASNSRIDLADCDCYLGQNEQLCKHVLALGLYVLHRAGQIDADCRPIGTNALSPTDAKSHISAGLRKIRAYNGPSRVWFSYQRDLSVGAGMITEGVDLLEHSLDNAKYLWDLVLKISKKFSTGGVDDSDGTVRMAVNKIIELIAGMAAQDSKIRDYALDHFTDGTGFGFEDDLAIKLHKIG